jgi:hypothetical protein
MTFREDGNVGINTTTPGAKLDVHSSGATVAQFNKTVSGNSYIQQLTAGAGKWKHGFTSATGAFDIIDDVNSLTRLSLLNTGQLKLNAYTSTSAFTGTTAGFLAFDASGNILSVTSPATSPAGTTGAVQFNNGGVFGADSTNFFWDDTNNRLGIGTATPSFGLDVSQNIGGNLFARLQNTNAGGFGMLLYAGSGVSTYTMQWADYSGSGGGRIYPEGVFIGQQSAPTARLQVQGSGSTSATTALSVANSLGNVALQVLDDSRVVLGISSDFAVYSSTGITARFPMNVGSTSLPTSSAVLQVTSTTQGFLPPRMTTAEKNAIGTPAAGLMVYDTTLNKLCVRTAAAWETITSI